MAGVSANNPQVAMAFDELTVFASWFNTAFDFHRIDDNDGTGVTPMWIIGSCNAYLVLKTILPLVVS